jgi:hypothetical protein
VSKWITAICFFVTQRTNDNCHLHDEQNGKRIQENHLGLRFPLETAARSACPLMSNIFGQLKQSGI